MNQFSKHILVLSIVLFLGSLSYFHIGNIRQKYLVSPFGYTYAFHFKKMNNNRSNEDSKNLFLEYTKKENIDLISISDRGEKSGLKLAYIGNIPESDILEVHSENIYRLGSYQPDHLIEYQKTDRTLDQGYFYSYSEDQINKIRTWGDSNNYRLYNTEIVSNEGLDILDDTGLLVIASGLLFLVAISFYAVVSLTGAHNIIFNGKGMGTVVLFGVVHLLIPLLIYGVIASVLYYLFIFVYQGLRLSSQIFAYIIYPSMVIYTVTAIIGGILIGSFIYLNSMWYKFEKINQLLKRIVLCVQSVIIVAILISGKDFVRIFEEQEDLRRTINSMSSTSYAILSSELPLSTFYEEWSKSPYNDINLRAKEALNGIEDKGGLAISVFLPKVSDDQFTPYGDIILMNDIYFNSFPEYQGRKLSESVISLDPESLPSSVTSFLKESFQEWGYNKYTDYRQFSFYEYDKDILTLPTRYYIHSSTDIYKPLIVVVPKISYLYRSDGLLGGSVEGTQSYFLDQDIAQNILTNIYPEYNPKIDNINDVLNNEMVEIHSRLSNFYIFVIVLFLIFLTLTIAYAKIDLLFYKDRFILSILNAGRLIPGSLELITKILIVNIVVAMFLLEYLRLYDQTIFDNMGYLTVCFMIQVIMVVTTYSISIVRYVDSGALADDLFV